MKGRSVAIDTTISTNLIVLLGVEAGLEGGEVVSRLARREDEVLLSDPPPTLAVVRGHLGDDGGHLEAVSNLGKGRSL